MRRATSAIVGTRTFVPATPLAVSVKRHETTGDHHRYEPGPVARVLRRTFARVSTVESRKKVATKLEKGLSEVERMEREAQWLRAHGSPLRVLGLPEHAELDEVRARYKDLLFETHPDTAKAVAAQQRVRAERERRRFDAAIAAGTTGDISRKPAAASAAAAPSSAPPSIAENGEGKDGKEGAAAESAQSQAGTAAAAAEDAAVAPAPVLSPEEEAQAVAGTGGKSYVPEELQRVSDEVRRRHQQESFELLQHAYKMIVDPKSVWHLNHCAPHILAELQPDLTLLQRVASPMNLFALMSNLLGLCAVAVFTVLVAPVVWESGLAAFDPKFFEFLKKQEAEERRKLEAGEEVDTNPTRLAPTQIQTMFFPGRLMQQRREFLEQEAAASPEEVATAESH